MVQAEGMTVRSRPALFTGIGLSILLVGGSVALWVGMGPLARSQWTWPQLLTIVIFLVVIVAVLMSVGLSTVHAGEDGVVVRNGLRTHRYAWDEVSDFTMNTGDPWAYMQLTPPEGEEEGDARMLLAVQRAEGAIADEHVAELRQLAEHYKG